MSEVDIEQVKDAIRQYVSLDEQIAMLAERKAEIKSRLTEAVESLGEVDGKGHVVLDVNETTTGTSRLMKQRKVSKPFNEEAAYELLEAKGLKEECTRKIDVLDQDKIMSALYRELLTEADIDIMFPPKVSYAFIVSR